MKNLLEENRRFFGKWAKYYDQGLSGFWLNKLVKKTLEFINIKESAKILDAGCGTGNLLFLLTKQGKKLKLYGTDITPEMLNIARAKLKHRAKLKLMSVEKLKFKKNYFDYIFSTEAFHHYTDQNKAMENFYRVLEKNGKLIIVDLDFGVFNSLIHKIEPGNTKMNSAEDFKKIFKDHKFRNIKQKRIGLFAILTTGEK